MKRITLGDSTNVEEILLEIFGEFDLKAWLDLEKVDEEDMAQVLKP